MADSCNRKRGPSATVGLRRCRSAVGQSALHLAVAASRRFVEQRIDSTVRRSYPQSMARRNKPGAEGDALALLVACIGSSGCTGAMPQLHPAKPLPTGSVELSAGVAGIAALGDTNQQIRRGRSSAAPQTAEAAEQFVEGAFRAAITAPGVGPWFSWRLGISGSNEAEVSFTGRQLRLGFRHAIALDSVWISGGVGGAFLHHRGSATADANTNPSETPTSSDLDAPYSLGGFDMNASGYAVDIPMTVGWQSQGEVVALWSGIRFGADQLFGAFSAGGESDADASARRFFGGGLVGFSVGVEPIRVRAELNATYSSARATVEPAGQPSITRHFAAWSLTPAAAIAVRF